MCAAHLAQGFQVHEFYHDCYIKNVLLHECPSTGGSFNLKVLYFRACVHHSVICDSPLNVFGGVKDIKINALVQRKMAVINVE